MASILKQKRFDSLNDGVQLVVFNVEDVQVRAREYLDEVRRQARQIVDDAHAEADSIRAQARQNGLADAESSVEQRIEAAAQKTSDQRCKTALAACEETIAQLNRSTVDWLSQFRDQTVELATKIAEKIIRSEVRGGSEVLCVWMEEALAAMKDSHEIRVHVHPDDFTVAGRHLQNIAKKVQTVGSVEILPDPEIQLGGCIARSPNGSIDQQLETQLQRLIEQLS